MNVRYVYLEIAIVLLFSIALPAFCQDTPEKTEAEKPKKEVKLIKDTFEDGLLINNQSVEVLRKNTLQFGIQHRFGRIDKGFEEDQNFDLLGILGPSNIRIGLKYGISDKITVGIGGTKNFGLYNIEWKYKILSQAESGGMPVTLSYYGNFVANTISADYFKHTIDRLSYFHQLLIARKLTKKLSLQIAAAVSHFNIIDTISYADMKNDNFNICFGGRYVIGAMGAFLFEYSHPITRSEILDAKPDLGIGFEISTRSHVFQIFLGTANGIINQRNVVFNTNDFKKLQMGLGFNITRNWNF